jgi:uncharacterized protein (TIGR02466 family)|tara:strand:- start:93 stop:749 length:657 start_codon:yes stop_codon:yes gene_type:complete
MTPFIVKNEDVKQTMQIQPIFPTPVGFLQMDKALNKKILEFIKIKQLKFIKNPAGNSISSDVYILDNDELSDIKKVLTDSVNEYFKKIVNPGKDMKLNITTSWINVNKNGESHHKHKHPNSIVSAILYIDTCEGDTISFIKEHQDLFGNFKYTGTHATMWYSAECFGSVVVNTLIMFPSTLPHQVNPRPNTCTGTRISLAFNTWFKGEMDLGVDSLRC